MVELRPTIESEYSFVLTIFGDTAQNKVLVNFPDGFILNPQYLKKQDPQGSPFFWTVWFGGKPVGSAYHYYMSRCNSCFFALGLSENFRGQSVGTNAAKLVVNQIFSMTPAHRIEAGASIENIPSNRALEKCGFVKEGVLRKGIIVEGKALDYVLWGLLKDDSPI